MAKKKKQWKESDPLLPLILWKINLGSSTHVPSRAGCCSRTVRQEKAIMPCHQNNSEHLLRDEAVNGKYGLVKR